MKKRSIFKEILIFGTLTMSSLAWGNDNNKFYAKCTTYGGFSTVSNRYEFYIPSPCEGKVLFVKGKSQFNPGRDKYAEAIVRHSSWVTTLAKFEFEENYIEINFSNYLSPSIGRGEVDGEQVSFACQLL